MNPGNATLLDKVADYYSAKLAEHGETAKGVDWNGEDSQRLRFQQLSRLMDGQQGFSVNDVGCGYGAFYDHLRGRYEGFSYHGIDISKDMIAAGSRRLAHLSDVELYAAAVPSRIADYGIACGIFNVRLGCSDTEWKKYIYETLDVLNETSSRGFAFNCLTSYSDPEKMQDYLYYADPCVMFDHCKRRYSKQVALLHDYGLYEFTVLVRKD